VIPPLVNCMMSLTIVLYVLFSEKWITYSSISGLLKKGTYRYISLQLFVSSAYSVFRKPHFFSHLIFRNGFSVRADGTVADHWILQVAVQNQRAV
jgi:hypothetical protein